MNLNSNMQNTRMIVTFPWENTFYTSKTILNMKKKGDGKARLIQVFGFCDGFLFVEPITLVKSGAFDFGVMMISF